MQQHIAACSGDAPSGSSVVSHLLGMRLAMDEQQRAAPLLLSAAAGSRAAAAQALHVAVASPRSAQDAATVSVLRMHTALPSNACRVLDGWGWGFTVPDTETVHTRHQRNFHAAFRDSSSAHALIVQRRPARHVSTPSGVPEEEAGWWLLLPPIRTARMRVCL